MMQNDHIKPKECGQLPKECEQLPIKTRAELLSRPDACVCTQLSNAMYSARTGVLTVFIETADDLWLAMSPSDSQLPEAQYMQVPQ